VSAAEISPRYGIDRRVLRRSKQELAMMTAAGFVTVQITDAEILGPRVATKVSAIAQV
jgi:hypothetical protein